MKSPRSHSNPHISPEKVGLFVHKNNTSTLIQENIEEYSRKHAEVEDKRSYSSPYYKGLTNFSVVLHRDKILGPSLEAESTMTHELQSLTSPYYKGLTDFTLAINREKPALALAPAPGSTSPGHESQAGSYVSSSSKTSFSLKIQEWGSSCFSFKTKNEKAPTMIKVYSTMNEEPLRERVSEPPPPPRSPLPPAVLPPPPPPVTKRVVINAEDTSEGKEEKKYFLADKYRPVNLKDFICNKDKVTELQKIARKDDWRHFIFEGPAGVGKRTMIWALLLEAFGPDKVQTRDKCKTFDLKGEEVSSIMVNVKESSQHVEVNLSELKGYEKHVIIELIKEANNCKAIILYEADKLSIDAQLYIRWVLERNKGSYKIFFCCNSVSKMQPLMALCNVVQLFPPSTEEIVEVLKFIAKEEEIELPKLLANRMAINSKNNLRQAIRSFEATLQSNSPLKEDQIIMTGWEDDIAVIAKSIVEKQSPKQLYDIRRKLQNLIEHSVSPEFIFDTLVLELKNNVDEPIHLQIDKIYKDHNGSNDDQKFPRFPCKRHEDCDKNHDDAKNKIIQQFMSIEEFIAKFMSYYKGHLTKKA